VIIQCVDGPMDGAVYHLDKTERNTNRKPDGLWFDAKDEGRNVRWEYIDTGLEQSGDDVVSLFSWIGGSVCEHGVKEGDWCEPCNRAYKDAQADPDNDPCFDDDYCRTCKVQIGYGSCDVCRDAGNAQAEAIVDSVARGKFTEDTENEELPQREHIQVGGSAADEAAGMAWWNSMTHQERAAALTAAGGNSSPADAYQWHLLLERGEERTLRKLDEWRASAVDESDIKELSRDLFGEGEEPLSVNQYRAIKCIIDERDQAIEEARKAGDSEPFREIAAELADRLARWTGTTVPYELVKATNAVRANKQTDDDLAASGGIVDAP